MALRHFEREREVIERGVQRAESLGVSGRVAREILETLIHHSLGKQETHKLAHSEHGQGKQALVVGGTGLYIRALTRGLFPSPPADRGLREELKEKEASSAVASSIGLPSRCPTK